SVVRPVPRRGGGVSDPRPISLVVTPAGDLAGVYDERVDYHAMGEVHITRASHVEPLLDGQWVADLSPVHGPLLGPYPLRSAAVAAELDWLDANLHLLCPIAPCADDRPARDH